MTDPEKPIFECWYYRLPWTRTLMCAYCLACSFVGLIGLTEHSRAIENAWGHYAVLLYSWTLIVLGLSGAVGIFRNIHATVVSVWAIGGATFFHGLAVLFTPGGMQTGLRLMIAPLMMVPLVWTWAQWLKLVKHVANLRWPPWRN